MSQGVMDGVNEGGSRAAGLPLRCPDADGVIVRVTVGGALPVPPLAPPAVTLAEVEALGEGVRETEKEGLGLASGEALL